MSKDDMSDIIVIHGPPGKDWQIKYGARLSEFFCKKGLTVNWRGVLTGKNISSLYLSVNTKHLDNYREMGFTVISIKDAIEKYDEAIPLTEWSYGNPELVGEYIASRFGADDCRRWWDGKSWSNPYYKNESQEKQNRLASVATFIKKDLPIEWRGLSKEPILPVSV